MSKKHFIALANALISVRPEKDIISRYSQWVDTRNAISKCCKVFNNNFDEDKFIEFTERYADESPN